MKTIQEIKSDFEQVISAVPQIQGLNTSDRVQIAIALLYEFGKYNRVESMSTIRENGNGSTPATEKQVSALYKFGAKFPETITKAEASELLDKLIAEAKNKKGR